MDIYLSSAELTKTPHHYAGGPLMFPHMAYLPRKCSSRDYKEGCPRHPAGDSTCSEQAGRSA